MVNNQQKIGSTNLVSKKKKIGFLVITIVIIAAIAAFIILRPSDTIVGQAYKIASDVDKSSITDQRAFFEAATGFASPGDTDVKIPLFINPALASGKTVSSFTVCFKYPFNQLSLSNIKVTAPGYGQVGPEPGTNLVTYFSKAWTDAKDPYVAGCPSGYTLGFAVSVSGSIAANQKIGTQVKVADVTFNVKSGASLSKSADEVIEVVTSKLKASDGGSLAKPSTASQTKLTIVPDCKTYVDSDNDGFPKKGLTFEAFNTDTADSKGDWRACGAFNAKNNPTNTITFDCNDNDAQMKPGLSETCDGKDNDCNGKPDDGLSGKLNNNNLKGVCVGKKLCLGSGDTNSYLVPANKQAQVKADTSLHPFATFMQGSTKVFSFEKYEAKDEKSCDGLDNDCDGSIDEGLVDCKVGSGGSSLIGGPPGNVWLEYGADKKLLPHDSTKASGSTYSKLQDRDGWLQTVFQLMYENVDPASCGNNCCGFAPHNPCKYAFAQNQNAHLCRDGSYYLEVINPSTKANVFHKFSPTGDMMQNTKIGACS